MNKLFFLAAAIVGGASALTRDELIDHLRNNQETRNTFDSRIRQGEWMKPVGYVGGKPIWPRILDKVRSPNELFFDDDNFAYLVHDRTPAGLVRKMDREANFNKVIRFLEKYT